jgi:hypothetical protein
MSEQISHQSRLAPTGPGRSSAMPSGPYESVPVKHSEQGALTVPFTGEDGRTKEYDFTRLPLPRMHRDLAIAFAARTGPGRLALFGPSPAPTAPIWESAGCSSSSSPSTHGPLP